MSGNANIIYTPDAHKRIDEVVRRVENSDLGGSLTRRPRRAEPGGGIFVATALETIGAGETGAFAVNVPGGTKGLDLPEGPEVTALCRWGPVAIGDECYLIETCGAGGVLYEALTPHEMFTARLLSDLGPLPVATAQVILPDGNFGATIALDGHYFRGVAFGPQAGDAESVGEAVAVLQLGTIFYAIGQGWQTLVGAPDGAGQEAIGAGTTGTILAMPIPASPGAQIRNLPVAALTDYHVGDVVTLTWRGALGWALVSAASGGSSTATVIGTCQATANAEGTTPFLVSGTGVTAYVPFGLVIEGVDYELAWVAGQWVVQDSEIELIASPNGTVRDGYQVQCQVFHGSTGTETDTGSAVYAFVRAGLAIQNKKVRLVWVDQDWEVADPVTEITARSAQYATASQLVNSVTISCTVTSYSFASGNEPDTGLVLTDVALRDGFVFQFQSLELAWTDGRWIVRNPSLLVGGVAHLGISEGNVGNVDARLNGPTSLALGVTVIAAPLLFDVAAGDFVLCAWNPAWRYWAITNFV